jgi:hypothetical protein
MVKKVFLTAVVLAALLAVPGLARAEDDELEMEGDGDQCATALLDCYERAARVENFWYRWAAGLDCELNFTSCVRIKLIGR